MRRVARYFDYRTTWLSLFAAMALAVVIPASASAQQDNDQIGSTRIVGGSPSSPGKWPNYVAILIEDGDKGFFCGGSIIDREWVLTAGHCIHENAKYTVFQGLNRGNGDKASREMRAEQTLSNLLQSGTPIPVNKAIRHEGFGTGCTEQKGPCITNDVALLRLSRPAATQGQILLSNKARPSYLVDRRLTTTIGLGTLKAGAQDQPGHLMQVDVPIVAASRCAALYGSELIKDFAICAGLEEGGRDSCQGDSGGPLYELSKLNQPVQIGVVSWGKGCAEAHTYGVYASVGYFENWIRHYVPNARFTTGESDTGSDQDLGSIAGGGNAPASQVAQVSVDMPGAQVKLGGSIEIRVTSSVAGHLFVFNEDSDGKTYQIFPNKFSGQNRPGQANTDIRAGQGIDVPDVMDRFKLTATRPTGMNRIIAIVVPLNVPTSDIASQHADMRPIADFHALLTSLAARTRGIAVEEVPTDRAIGLREYEIVD